jgi:hypothetical protein
MQKEQHIRSAKIIFFILILHTILNMACRDCNINKETKLIKITVKIEGWHTTGSVWGGKKHRKLSDNVGKHKG